MVNPAYEDPAAVQPPDPSASRIEIPVEWSVKKPAPRVELDVRIARAKTSAQVAERDAKRAVDAETLKPIEEDMVKSRAHALEIQSEIERVQKMLEAPTPQYQEPQMGLHQLLAAGIASMFGGAQGFNQAAQGFQEHNQALAAQRYKESLQEAENHREMVMARLRELGIDKETAQRAYEMFQKRAWDVQDQQTSMDAAAANDQRDFEREKLRQDALTGRAELSSADKDKAARNTILKTVLPYATTPEERNKLIDWAANMRPDELQIVAGLSDAEVLQRARTANTEAKTKTEDAMRGPKVEKVKAEVEKILTGTIKDKAATDLYRARVAQYPLESQARIANIYSQIEKRSQEVKAGGGKPEKYYGAGLETSLEQLKRIAQNTLSGFATVGGNVDQEAFKSAMEDLTYATAELEKIQKAKAEYAKTEMNRRHGGGSRPQSQIDTSGGFAPVAPVVPGVTDSPFAGARAAAGAQRPKTKPKAKPKATPKTNKTRSGTSYEFIPD